MSGRVNSFAILSDPNSFAPKPKPAQRVEEAAIDGVARRTENFPSRQPQKANVPAKRRQRCYRTGRDRHLGVRGTAETVESFYKAADARNVPLGELLRLALDPLEKAG